MSLFGTSIDLVPTSQGPDDTIHVPHGGSIRVVLAPVATKHGQAPVAPVSEVVLTISQTPGGAPLLSFGTYSGHAAITSEGSTILVPPEDTASLQEGQTYYYNVWTRDVKGTVQRVRSGELRFEDSIAFDWTTTLRLVPGGAPTMAPIVSLADTMSAQQVLDSYTPGVVGPGGAVLFSSQVRANGIVLDPSALLPAGASIAVRETWTHPAAPDPLSLTTADVVTVSADPGNRPTFAPDGDF